MAVLDPAQPMRPGLRYKVGSITKMFAATLVVQLAAEHTLGLGDPVARWLPGLVPNGGHITLRQLLQHTSGLFDYAQDPPALRALPAGRPRLCLESAAAGRPGHRAPAAVRARHQLVLLQHDYVQLVGERAVKALCAIRDASS